MKKGGLWLSLFVVVLAVAAVLSFGYLKDNLNLGLDLQGGAEVVLQAVPEEGQTVSSDDMEALKEIMRKRVDNIGVSEPVIQLEGTDRIIVQLAGVDNPDEAIEILGKTAKLEFVDPRGNIILTGSDLADPTSSPSTPATERQMPALLTQPTRSLPLPRTAAPPSPCRRSPPTAAAGCTTSWAGQRTAVRRSTRPATRCPSPAMPPLPPSGCSTP